MGKLANLELAARNYPQAANRFHECLELVDTTTDPENRAWLTSNVGLAELHSGNLDAAAEALRESLGLLNALGWSEGLVYSLLGLAAVAADSSEERAAVLIGASERLREELVIALQTTESRLAEQTLWKLRSTLDQTTFDRAWESGRALSLDEAVEYALASID